MASSRSTTLLLALSLQGASSFQTSSPLPISSPSFLQDAVRIQPSARRSTEQQLALFATNDAAADDDTTTTPKKDDCGCDNDNDTNPDDPPPLQPYLPAMNPKYSSTGPIGQGKFLISRSGPPTPQELTNEQMLQIVKLECNDLEVNTLVWKCLGYRFDEEEESWSPTEVFPNWKERFPTPPDFIGMQRVYSREVDQPSLRSNQALVRSIPADNKQSLKTQLKPLGWKGYQYKELTPNKTRRAQCANWLIFYREELFGYTVEELRERRRLRKEAEAAAEAKRKEEEGDESDDTWKLPVTEVF